MRYLITFSLVCLLSMAVSAQNKEKLSFKKLNSGIDLFTDIWQGMPDSVDTRTLNQGINIYSMYTFPINKSNFTFAIGAGIGSHNLYSKGVLAANDTLSYFSPISGVSYDKSKLTLTYLDFPLELRIKTKAEFRASIGFKLGVLISDHTKYKGNNEAGKSVKEKSIGVDHLENLRYGLTALAGYKWFNLTFFYSLSKAFVKDKGPQVYPISIGIALRPF